VKLGVSGDVGLGSLGPGGAELHLDFSSATPFLEVNLLETPKSVLIAKIQSEMDDSWFLSMTDEQLNNFANYIYGSQVALKKMFDDNNKPAATTTPQTSQPTQQVSTQQGPVQKKAEQKQSQQKVTPKKATNQSDNTKKNNKGKWSIEKQAFPIT
jgi:hypothetical protein